MSAGAGFTSRPSPDFRSTAIVGFRSPRPGGSPRAVRRPPVLDDLGLVAAVEWYVQDFATRAGLAHELHVGVDELTLDGDRAASVFRILQEALTNVARHAEATRVAVSLATSDEALTLTVEDDGTGISDAGVEEWGFSGSVGDARTSSQSAGADRPATPRALGHRPGAYDTSRGPSGGRAEEMGIKRRRVTGGREGPVGSLHLRGTIAI